VSTPADGAVAGLYPIVDFDACARNEVEPSMLARAILAAAPNLVQLRAKGIESGRFLATIDALLGPARERNVALVVNDRPDLATLSGAPFVHVGQEDLSPADVRRFDPELGVGISTHDLEQLQAALAESPAYVAFGPVFPTQSKHRPDRVVGLEALARAHELTLAAPVPLVANGGITTAKVVAVRRHCEAVAVISALFEGGHSESAIAAHVKGLVERCA
jgi:thiamine-phosphate pyrophosphorylase